MKIRSMILFAWVLVCSGASADPAATEDWAGWAKRMEKLHPVTDAQGHGPDIGSDEWAQALDKRLGIRDEDADAPEVGSDEWRSAVEKRLKAKAPDPQEQRKLLSSHDTLARFAGIADHVCRGRTALCPDRCGHSGKLATFEVLEYQRYEKAGEYGDPRQERFQVLIADNQKNPKVPAEIHKTILALKPGDTVRLVWHHDYVTRDGSSFPDRPIIRLEPVPGEPAADDDPPASGGGD